MLFSYYSIVLQYQGKGIGVILFARPGRCFPELIHF